MKGARPYIALMLPKPFSWDRATARSGKFDGKFVIGVLTTGIYCLPSCPVHPPKPHNVRLFKTEEEAKIAGLRACKRCRPDLFYRGEEDDTQLFDGLIARVYAHPEAFSNASALAKSAGVSQAKLNVLFRVHAHLAPTAWLRRERVRAAMQKLLGGEERVVDVGYAAGFESESVFHRQFLALSRMTPDAYRALKGASVFLLQLPPGYRAVEILAYHARDPESRSEKSEGHRIWKALSTEDGPAVLEISLEDSSAWCQIHAARKMGARSMTFLHAAALRMLGLRNEARQFETRMMREPAHAKLVSRRRGLRLPLLATGFDGLCWGIIGQQINIKFASALRREIVELGGEDAGGGMRTHPTPQRVVDIGAAALAKRRYSRAKAEYLMGAAREVAEGRLDIEGMAGMSAVDAEKKLRAIRGIGIWTARYVLMRAGFADSAPVGDSALATALQRLHAREQRPRHEEVHEMMKAFSPHRSLATAHLWASLKDAA